MDNLDDLLNKIKSNDEISIEEKQQIRTELRQRFLKLITRLQGKQCSFKTCENTNVEALFKVCDPNFETIIVENLKTPVMSYDNVKLRETIASSNNISTTLIGLGVMPGYGGHPQ
ncbi:uncharacterized protein LOC123297675 [Chrysoperla carnea]|uniref:uncharacterized protein LOC123297675 n=1 Tax=Chrysoperla carnea TaxID=189513 RepID=UPI001D08F5B4|nr:uncharacterized protein LOC123297675 [Chrysoperla carnea]